ncbi:MAG: hypothetical protein KGJ60_13590, partial [Verrucomicrobiota bacterium]|nr:hypothetical protein [Verrucomicrobiota bacterium]
PGPRFAHWQQRLNAKPEPVGNFPRWHVWHALNMAKSQKHVNYYLRISSKSQLLCQLSYRGKMSAEARLPRADAI